MNEQGNNIGDELRAVMTGQRDPNAGMLRRCAEKLARWQQLARKYHGPGLTWTELDEFWREVTDQRTNVQLILEISVRRQDLAAAGQEVKAFMDELALEMMAAQRAQMTATNSSEIVYEMEENTDNSEENNIQKEFKKILKEKYNLGERTKLSVNLAKLLTRAQLVREEMAASETEEETERKLGEPGELLEFLDGYIQALEEQEPEPEEITPPGWRVRFFGQ